MTQVRTVVTSWVEISIPIGKVHEGAFWNAGNIVYFDLDGSDMGVNVKIHQAVHLRLVYFTKDIIQ